MTGAAPRARRAGGRKFVVGLVLIAAFALAGRVVYIVTVARWSHAPSYTDSAPGTHRSFDEYYYSQGTIAFVEGDGLRFSPVAGAEVEEQGPHPPLTIVLLAPTAWLMDGNETAMRFTVAIAGAGVVIVLGLIGRRLAGDRAGLIAAVIAAVYPNLWVNDGIILAETFATLFTAFTIYFTYLLIHATHATGPEQSEPEPSSRSRSPFVYTVAAGISCALAMLSRSELALLVPLLVVPAVLLVTSVAWRRRLALAGVACLAAALAVTPWLVNDLARFDEPVFLSTGGGDVLRGANCDDTYGGPRLGYWNGTCHPVPRVRGDLSVHAAETRRAGLEYMTNHLDELPLVMAARVGRVWSVFRPIQMARDNQFEGRPYWVSVAGLVLYFPLVLLAVAGAVFLRRQRESLTPLLGPIVITTLTAAAFYGLVRFRAPAEASSVVLAAVALDAFITRRTTARVEIPDASRP